MTPYWDFQLKFLNKNYQKINSEDIYKHTNFTNQTISCQSQQHYLILNIFFPDCQVLFN